MAPGLVTFKPLQLLALLLLLSIFSTAAETRIDPEQCGNYRALFDNIDRDLQPWNETGITRKLLQITIRDHASLKRSPHSQKGFAVGFVNGVAVLLREPELRWVGHHVAIWIVYMQALLQLQRQLGSLIPNVEFVISTVDRPLRLLSNSTATPNQPVLRFCKTDSHPDILIPDFHFYVKGIISLLLKSKRWFDKQYPWGSRRETLFGRFTPYHRYLHPQDSFALRRGAGSQDICTSTHTSVSCNVREHFAQWAKSQNTSLLDVDIDGRLPMKHHAKYKYLAHLDGQGLSSRLEQLLTLGSVVFKEQSGYRAFYHGLLQPHVHYVPFWKQVPEDVLPALEWARTHDNEARIIADNAQQLAHRYFSREALACYWLTLLTRLSKLQRYLTDPGAKPIKYFMTVQAWLDNIGRTHGDGRSFRAFTFVDAEIDESESRVVGNSDLASDETYVDDLTSTGPPQPSAP